MGISELVSIGLACCATAGFTTGWMLRRGRRRPETFAPLRRYVYLNDTAIKDLYKQIPGAPHQKAEVEETSSGKRDVKMGGKLGPMDAGAGGEKANTTTRKFNTNEDAVNAITVVTAHLEKANRIIFVDLVRQTVRSNRALATLVRSDDTPAKVRLSDLDLDVSIKGEFHVTRTTNTHVVLRASYGNPSQSEDSAPSIWVSCAKALLRQELHAARQYRMTCLGRAGSWDAETEELEVRPISIFLS